MIVKFLDGLENNSEFINYTLNSIKEVDSMVSVGDDPDVIFYSDYGNKFIYYDCVRFYVASGNANPNFDFCDYAVASVDMEFEDRYCKIADILDIAHGGEKYKEYIEYIFSQSKDKLFRRCNVYHSYHIQRKMRSLCNYEKFFEKHRIIRKIFVR